MNKKGKGIHMLFITQKIHKNDDDLASVILWIKQFEKEGFNVSVICLEKGDFDDSFPVYSLGKEKGYGKFRRIICFLKYIFTLKYDRVFVHMNPEYFTLGGWYWFLKRIPTYLWYTHYKMHIHLRIAGLVAKRMFAATSQSLPQYERSAKKVITGHGIDLSFWTSSLGSFEKYPEQKMLSVHRICRSKRFEICIRSLKFLPEEYTLTHYGGDVEKDYADELRNLVKDEKLEGRVLFQGSLPMGELEHVYDKFRIMVNMASETIDKTMLEGMLFGIYPVTTKGNSIAIGLPEYPEDDRPESIARFISSKVWEKYDTRFLVDIVKNRHGLEQLVRKMSSYIKEGK